VLESPSGTDYTVYTKKDMTLRRGERAIVTLFVTKIQYGHIYRWSPPEAMQHFLVLQNDTDTAWTTGPCLAVSGNRPLSEDMLRYTPKGGKCELPVTTAVNVAHDKSEAEIDRKFRAHSPSQHTFLDLVTLEGELKVKNLRNARRKSSSPFVSRAGPPIPPTTASAPPIRTSSSFSTAPAPSAGPSCSIPAR